MPTNPLWTFIPNVFEEIKIQDVINECDPSSWMWSTLRNYNGEEINITRKSCVFTDNIKTFRKKLPSYSDLKCYEWSKSPITLKIKEKLEELLNHKFDYVLLHCYEDGKASIGYHNDKEALNSMVASVSVGSKRKFRIRRIGETRGYIEEFELGNGDLFIMEKGMQCKFIHSIVKQLRIKEPRCNWTFRNFP